MGTRLTIGDFSRVTHLSVKTLRHYHQVGLLEPDTVDAHNGYRYYSAAQVPAAQVIRRLRELEMPIPDVKAVLASPVVPERNARIAAHLDALEAELARTRQSVQALRDLLDRPADATTLAARIEYRTLPPTPAVGIQQVVDREDLLAWWQGALGELTGTIRAQGLRPNGPSGGLYANEIFLHERGEATVFVPVDGAVRAIGRVVPFVVPGAELAVVRHSGSLSDIDVTYGELGTYALNHEISVDGPLREYYLCGMQDTDDVDTWETELGWPVFRADAGDASAREAEQE